MNFDDVLQRIEARCLRAASGCFEFQGCKCWQGYGRIRWRGRMWLVHRLVLSASLGRELKANELAGHRCNNPRCCDSAHLYVATPGENQAHAYRDGLRQRNRPRLTVAQVQELRELAKAGWTRQRLADRFGVSTTTAHLIIHRKKWASVP